MDVEAQQNLEKFLIGNLLLELDGNSDDEPQVGNVNSSEIDENTQQQRNLKNFLDNGGQQRRQYMEFYPRGRGNYFHQSPRPQNFYRRQKYNSVSVSNGFESNGYGGRPYHHQQQQQQHHQHLRQQNSQEDFEPNVGPFHAKNRYQPENQVVESCWWSRAKYQPENNASKVQESSQLDSRENNKTPPVIKPTFSSEKKRSTSHLTFFQSKETKAWTPKKSSTPPQIEESISKESQLEAKKVASLPIGFCPIVEKKKPKEKPVSTNSPKLAQPKKLPICATNSDEFQVSKARASPTFMEVAKPVTELAAQQFSPALEGKSVAQAGRFEILSRIGGQSALEFGSKKMPAQPPRANSFVFDKKMPSPLPLSTPPKFSPSSATGTKRTSLKSQQVGCKSTTPLWAKLWGLLFSLFPFIGILRVQDSRTESKSKTSAIGVSAKEKRVAKKAGRMPADVQSQHHFVVAFLIVELLRLPWQTCMRFLRLVTECLVLTAKSILIGVQRLHGRLMGRELLG